jgi:hypothetical protein
MTARKCFFVSRCLAYWPLSGALDGAPHEHTNADFSASALRGRLDTSGSAADDVDDVDMDDVDDVVDVGDTDDVDDADDGEAAGSSWRSARFFDPRACVLTDGSLTTMVVDDTGTVGSESRRAALPVQSNSWCSKSFSCASSPCRFWSWLRN